MHHVVAGLEGECDGGRVNTTPCASALGHARRKVRDRKHRKPRRRNYDARGHRQVREGHHAAAQWLHLVLLAILRRGAKRLDQRDSLVGEMQL